MHGGDRNRRRTAKAFGAARSPEDDRAGFAVSASQPCAIADAGRMDGLGQSRRWTLRAEDYERLRASGAILSVWTVNEPKEVAAWDRRGFAYVTSDVPEKMIGRA